MAQCILFRRAPWFPWSGWCWLRGLAKMIYSSCNELYSGNRILWLLSPLTRCKRQHSLAVIRSLARFSLVKYSSITLSPHPILTLQKITLHHPTARSYKWVIPRGHETLRWSNTRRWKTGSLLGGGSQAADQPALNCAPEDCCSLTQVYKI